MRRAALVLIWMLTTSCTPNSLWEQDVARALLDLATGIGMLVLLVVAVIVVAVVWNRFKKKD